MQIRLLPSSPHPAILFTIAYPEPPEYLGIPAAWATQLHRLSIEELEMPHTLLAMDKTTWLSSVLQIVTFDLSCYWPDNADTKGFDRPHRVWKDGKKRGMVSCLFADGRTVEWEMGSSPGAAERGEPVQAWEARACMEMLDSVLRDVTDSAVEAEREKWKYKVPYLPPTSVAAEGDSLPPPGTGKQGKHKKQRSLLMSLVASLVSPRSSFSAQASPPPAPHPPPPPPPPPPQQIIHHHSSLQNLSSLLRRRARSTLVNAFRRYILCKLSTALLTPTSVSSALCMPTNITLSTDCYMIWISRSMLERVEAEMEDMILEAGGVPSLYMAQGSHQQSGMYSRASMEGDLSWQEGDNIVIDNTGRINSGLGIPFGLDVEPSPTLVDEPPPFSDDIDDDEAVDTETDDSSVHTPTDGAPIEGSPFVPSARSPSPQTCAPQVPRGHPAGNFSSTPSKPSLRLTLPRTPSPPSSPPLSPPAHLSSLPSSAVPSNMSSTITISMPQPHFTPSALAAYSALSSQRFRLCALLTHFEAQQQNIATDERQLQTILEVKSRRRAWSNRQYMGKADVRFVGFGVPTKSSPLARAKPICAEDVVVVSSLPLEPNTTVCLEGVRGPERVRKSVDLRGELVVTTAENNIMRLFPVCEEDEDEGEDVFGFGYGSPGMYATSASRADLAVESGLSNSTSSGFYMHDPTVPSVRLVEDSILRDAEAGLLTPLPLQRHPVPIRPRTRSMIQISGPPTPPLSPTSPSSPPSPSPTVTSYTSSALDIDNEKAEFGILEPQTKIELFDVDDDSDEGTLGELGFKSEFTLSMDLPPPYRSGADVHAITRHYDNWIVSSRTSNA